MKHDIFISFKNLDTNLTQFASELQVATADLFAHELKNEIFGYNVNEVAA